MLGGPGKDHQHHVGPQGESGGHLEFWELPWAVLSFVTLTVEHLLPCGPTTGRPMGRGLARVGQENSA